LLRFINEFWYVKTTAFTNNVEEVIKSESSNANINLNMKLRNFNSIEEIVKYTDRFKESISK